MLCSVLARSVGLGALSGQWWTFMALSKRGLSFLDTSNVMPLCLCVCGTLSGQLLRLISVSEEGLSFSNTNGVSPVWRIKKEKRKGITNYQCPFGMDPNNYPWWLKVLWLSLFLSPGHDMLRGADQVLHLCLPLIPWNRLLLTNSGILFILFYWSGCFVFFYVAFVSLPLL